MPMNFSLQSAKRLFSTFSLSLVIASLLPSIAAASALEYTSDTTVEYGSVTLVIAAGSTASIVTINTSNINVVTGPGDSFTITSPAFYQITSSPEQTTTCTETLSRVVVGENQTVTLTPTTTPCASTPAPQGSSAPRPEPQPSYSETVIETPVVNPVVLPVEPVFTTADYFSDIAGLTERQRSDIIAITQHMIENKTLFAITQAKKYYPNHILTYGYATQIANSFSPLGCGSNEYLGIYSCREHAIKMGYLQSGRPVNSRITRLDFYRLILKTLGKKVLVKKNALAQVAKYCSDSAGISVADANLYLTARQYNIVSRFKSGKCQLNLNLPRLEAAGIGARLMAR